MTSPITITGVASTALCGLGEPTVKGAKGHGAGQMGERPVIDDLLSRAEKARPGCPGECPTHANAANAQFRQRRDRREVASHQHIDR